MKLSFRWYGPDKDPISLEYISQIPNVASIVTQCYKFKPGVAWESDEIIRIKKLINDHHLNWEVVESIPVHEDIKLGLPTRDEYIKNYCTTIERLAKEGIKVICYNFMPAFDWVRTDLYKKMRDGSLCEAYDQNVIDQLDATSAIKKFKELPAWTLSFPDEQTAEIIGAYQKMSDEELWDNIAYFINKVIPVCDQVGVKMAIHPDDPAWPIFGIPRLIINEENLARFLAINPSPNHGLTLCVGSLSTNLKNNMEQIVRRFVDRIHFTHIRNIRYDTPHSFYEIAHGDHDGVLDLSAIVKAYADNDYQGYARPDHGRLIWGEEKQPHTPGYGLYDRALGLSYINGLWDAYQKTKK
ncbi:mannonate dehydratase [Spiroplasma eriocheiris]|uniref:Mannonate dehydratase n=1 Tax=Spiroplasma eriocheiris TaxID=315358 RepID=A0A0H3XJ52_9MOLU|nr:mannonate dehydratase [Spiroplasma eriocheiris]AHF57380.1 mannonate dehydratase [Spiroplasma eriocheiris CCTCC M 207170]AKM53836.1 Mannonate dehydratase [Spiroplasma eriocheiris]